MVNGENENWYIFFVNAEFYRVVWTINALLTVRSERLPFSENNQAKHKKCSECPEHFAIGYVHNDNLPLGNIALQYMYVIQNNCRKVWWCFSNDSLHFLKIKKKNCRIHQNYLVALMDKISIIVMKYIDIQLSLLKVCGERSSIEWLDISLSGADPGNFDRGHILSWQEKKSHQLKKKGLNFPAKQKRREASISAGGHNHLQTPKNNNNRVKPSM